MTKHITEVSITPAQPIRLMYGSDDPFVALTRIEIDVTQNKVYQLRLILDPAHMGITPHDHSEDHSGFILQVQAVLSTYGIHGDVPPIQFVIDPITDDVPDYSLEDGEDGYDPHIALYDVYLDSDSGADLAAVHSANDAFHAALIEQFAAAPGAVVTYLGE